MNLRIIAALIILLATYQAVASAAVIHISQGDLVYYGDTVDMRGIVGITNNVSWWKTNDDPAVDPPDHIVTFGIDPFYPNNISAYKVTVTLEPGLWYQWDGYNERKPVVAFYLMAMTRPVNLTPTPTPTHGILAPVVVNPQPQPIADLLIARWDNATYFLMNSSQVWLLGPSLATMGNQTGEDLFLPNVDLQSGEYSLLIQHPDANGIYEVFRDPLAPIINSTWKDVPAWWYAPMTAPLIRDRLMAMFRDTAHFHGIVVQKLVVIQDQRADVTNLYETDTGTLVISGITNLAKGDVVKAIFDEDKNPLASDLRKMTFYANVTGDDPGAYRLWQATVAVNLQTQTPGNHFISVYTPDGTKTIIPFYLSEAFKPFQPPAGHIMYLNNSPFLPVPTPVIIEKVVPVTVIQTVMVPVTPAYEVVLAAQTEAAASERKTLEGNILMAGLLIGLIGAGSYGGYRGIRYLAGVVRRARGMG